MSDSDSESEIGGGSGKKSTGATAKRKPSSTAKAKASSAQRKTSKQPKESSFSGSAPSSQESCTTPSVEERKCPMAGCDSSGKVLFIVFGSLSLQLMGKCIYRALERSE